MILVRVGGNFLFYQVHTRQKSFNRLQIVILFVH